MKKTRSILLVVCLLGIAQGAENIRKVGTWNMKWLGTNSGNQLDPIENVPEYANYIVKTGATLFALEEIGATHSIGGQPRCYYLDCIVAKLNENISSDSEKWAYTLDDKNESQRLAFLYKQDQWSVSDAHTIWPGSSYQSARRPFVATVKAIGDNAALQFTYIGVHFKAFPDTKSRNKRKANIKELAAWLKANGATLDGDVLIAGDTNIYAADGTAIDKPLKNIGYTAFSDPEGTNVYKGAIGERFDRFFCSPDLLKEINSAKAVVGSTDYIDAVEESDLTRFADTLSDHFPVVLCVDASEER
jgi:predicted extracellular nuclease